MGYIAIHTPDTIIEITESRLCNVQSFKRNESTESDFLTVRFISAEYFNIPIGSYINQEETRFYMISQGIVKKNNSRNFDHTFIFHSPLGVMNNYKMLNNHTNYEGKLSFFMNGTITDFVALIKHNMERCDFHTYDYEAAELTDTKNINFNDVSCLEALKIVSEEFDTEFWLDSGGLASIIHIGKRPTEYPIVFEYGENKGLISITEQPDGNKTQVKRLYVEGGERNIPKNYENDRLLMPGGQKYLNNDVLGVEEYVMFDDIYPHREGTITVVESFDEFIDHNMPFNLNETTSEGESLHLISGVSAKIHFNSGNLEGYEFEILGYNHSLRKFKLKQQESDYGVAVPNQEQSAYQMQVGDKYVILDIRMPESYVSMAESKLYQRAHSYFEKLKKEPKQLLIEIDPYYIKKKKDEYGSMILKVGQEIIIKDDSFNIYNKMIIKSKETNYITNSKYIENIYETKIQIKHPDEQIEDVTVPLKITLEHFDIWEYMAGFGLNGSHLMTLPYESELIIPVQGTGQIIAMVLMPKFKVISGNVGSEISYALHEFKLYKNDILIHTVDNSLGAINTQNKWCYLEKTVELFGELPMIEAGIYTFELTVSDGIVTNTESFSLTVSNE